MNEQIYADLKNALGAFGTQFTTALEKAGAATEVGYNIVKQRVIAESVIGVIFGSVILLLLIWLIIFSIRKVIEYSKVLKDPNNGLNFEKEYDTKENRDGYQIFIILLIVFLFTTIGLSMPSIINLISPDYATIERIVNLAKSVK